MDDKKKPRIHITYLRKIVQSKCKWCGAEIEGLKTMKYCKPENGKTASICKIRADAKAREAKKAKRLG